MTPWEEMRYEMERSLHDAELANALWNDPAFRKDLRLSPGQALGSFRLWRERPGTAPSTSLTARRARVLPDWSALVARFLLAPGRR